jgi:hypothetical protein
MRLQGGLSRVWFPAGARFFLSPKSSVRATVLPRHLVNKYQWLFPRGKSGRSVKLTVHLRPVPKFRMCGVIILPLLCAFKGSAGTNLAILINIMYCVPGVDSASNRNEYREYLLGGKCGRCVRLTTLPPSCAVVKKSGNLNFLEPSGPPQACNGTALPLLLMNTTDELENKN